SISHVRNEVIKGERMEHLDDGFDMFTGLDGDQLPSSAPPIPQQQKAQVMDPFLLAADEQTWDLADWDWDPVNCVARRKGDGNGAQPSDVGTNVPMEGMQMSSLPAQQGSVGGGGSFPSRCQFQLNQSSLPTTPGALDWSALPPPVLPPWQPPNQQGDLLSSQFSDFQDVPHMDLNIRGGLLPTMPQPCYDPQHQLHHESPLPPLPPTAPAPPNACSHHAALAACALRPPNRKRSNNAVGSQATTDARQRQRRIPCPLHTPPQQQHNLHLQHLQHPQQQQQQQQLQHTSYLPMDMSNLGWEGGGLDAADKAAAAAVAAMGEMGQSQLPGLFPSGLEGVVSISDPPPPDQSGNRMVCQVAGCGRDLTSHKEYHHRYRICEVHIKLPQVLKDGRLQRFCQQCGRFHDLMAFDGSRRSCRDQLDKHNARRRKRAQVDSQKTKALEPKVPHAPSPSPNPQEDAAFAAASAVTAEPLLSQQVGC
ncbi:SBP domain-containing protein, partial [Dunaliella salina]